MNKKLLLIPVEDQVRELDPKLLLACVAAERGFPSVIGSRREMEFNIDMFPHSIYLWFTTEDMGLFEPAYQPYMQLIRYGCAHLLQVIASMKHSV